MGVNNSNENDFIRHPVLVNQQPFSPGVSAISREELNQKGSNFGLTDDGSAGYFGQQQTYSQQHELYIEEQKSRELTV